MRFSTKKEKQSELCKIKIGLPKSRKTFWEKGEAREQAQTFFAKRKSKQSELCKVKNRAPEKSKTFWEKGAAA